MSREKIEANNERKKNYKQYNRKAKAKKLTAYIPVIVIIAIVVLFAGVGAYAGYTSYKAKNPTYDIVNMEPITNYTDTLDKVK